MSNVQLLLLFGLLLFGLLLFGLLSRSCSTYTTNRADMEQIHRKAPATDIVNYKRVQRSAPATLDRQMHCNKSLLRACKVPTVGMRDIADAQQDT
jgi:hypothetical protein